MLFSEHSVLKIAFADWTLDKFHVSRRLLLGVTLFSPKEFVLLMSLMQSLGKKAFSQA